MLLVVISAVVAGSVDPIASFSDLAVTHSPRGDHHKLHLDDYSVGVADSIDPSYSIGVHLRGVAEYDDQRRVLRNLTTRRLKKEKEEKKPKDSADEESKDDKKVRLHVTHGCCLEFNDS